MDFIRIHTHHSFSQGAQSHHKTIFNIKLDL